MQSVPAAGTGSPPQRGALMGFYGRALAVACLALLASCGTPGEVTTESAIPPERIFSAGFADLQEIYIADLDLGTVTLRGVNSLSTLEPGVAMERQSDQVVVVLDGKVNSNYPAPAAEDAQAWGQLAGEVVRNLRQQSAALGATDSEKIYETMFDAVVRDLDPFSRYSSRDEARENRASRDGFGGIGVRIDVTDEGVKVLSVMDETPAQEAGLQSADLIVMIDGQSAAGLDQRDVIQRLRGPIGSTVKLTVERGTETLVIPIERAHIVPQTVTAVIHGDIAEIKLTSFNHSTAETLRDKILDLQRTMARGLKGIVIDLRGNPGGLLDQSVAVADLFLPAGKIVTTHGRHRDSHQYFNADSFELAKGVPIVVLMNAHSASASEIVAAALQDAGRAVIVGSVSYGKGTVQTVLSLPNEAELTLTWAKFHAPSGYSLHERGVMPDICTSGSAGIDAVLREIRRGDLPLPATLRQSNVDDSDDAAVAAFKAHCPEVETENALDLEVALRLLEDQQLYAAVQGGQAASASP